MHTVAHLQRAEQSGRVGAAGRLAAEIARKEAHYASLIERLRIERDDARKSVTRISLENLRLNRKLAKLLGREGA